MSRDEYRHLTMRFAPLRIHCEGCGAEVELPRPEGASKLDWAVSDSAAWDFAEEHKACASKAPAPTPRTPEQEEIWQRILKLDLELRRRREQDDNE